MGTFESQIEEIKQQTLYRIRDCEELMRIRVNEEYVQEEINALELRLSQKFSSSGNSNAEAIKKINKELRDRIIALEQRCQSHFSAFQGEHKEHKANIAARLKVADFRQYIEETERRFLDITTDYQKMWKDQKDVQVDVNRQFSLLKKKDRDLQQMIEDLNDKIENNLAHGPRKKGDGEGDGEATGPAPDLTIFENMIKELKK